MARPVRLSGRTAPHVFAAGFVAFLVSVLPAGTFKARAQSFDFTIGGADVHLDLESYRARQFATVIRQKTDFSCGSASLATLLTYHYGIEVTEDDVFRAMWEAGEQDKIRERGFSLLDMKRFLAVRNMQADGYRLSLDKLAEVGVPAIALIDVEGYKHFVVIKGIRGDRVLVGDPSVGLVVRTLEEFTQSWDGTVFFIRSFVDRGKAGWNRDADWAAHPTGRPEEVSEAVAINDRIWLRTSPLDSAFGILGPLTR